MGITLPSTPSAAMLNLSALVYLLGLTIITWCIAHTTHRHPIWRKGSWSDIPWPRLCLLLLFMGSWLYLFSTGLLLHGAPPQHGVNRCSVGMLACILLYGASKGLIYLCMIERVHVVWGDGLPRWRSPIYRFCFALLLPLVVIAGVMIFQKTAFVHNGYCILGISRFSSLLLLSYDFCTNVFLTMMFVGPLVRSSIRSPWLRAIAIRTTVAAFVALLSSGTNVLVLYVLDGKEMIWVCLGACGTDLIVNCIALSWAMTGPDSSQTAQSHSLQFPPSPMGHNPWLNNCNFCGSSEMKSFKSVAYPTTFTHDYGRGEHFLSQGMTAVSSVCIPVIEEPKPALRSPRQFTQFGQQPWGSQSSFPPPAEQPADDRVASIFPTVAKRSSYLQTPRVVFFIGKHFGTGVILATAFIHLLKDAFVNMSKAQVNARWGKYESWPGLIIMSALLSIFLVEYTSTVYVEYIAEQSALSEPQESQPQNDPAAPKRPGLEHVHTDCLHGEVHVSEGEATRIVGVFVLQLGIMLHSIVVGFTLAVTNGAEFTSLLIALIFHQLFEGLSLGVRISSLRPTLFAPHQSSSNGSEESPLLPSSGRSKAHARAFPMLPLLLAGLFALATPAGMLVGILLRTAPQDAFLVRGLASAVSAGLLIYASCVELLAGDFVANPKMREAGFKRQAAALGSLLAGAAGMAIIGIWS